MSQNLQNVEVPGSSQTSVCKRKRVLALDQSSSEKVAKITLHRAGIQPCSLLGWGNNFPYPNNLTVLYRIAWGKQKSTYAEIIATSSRSSWRSFLKKGLYLTGEQKLNNPGKKPGEHRGATQNRELALTEVKEKWGKLTTKERNRKENTIKWESDPEQARCNQLKKW